MTNYLTHCFLWLMTLVVTSSILTSTTIANEDMDVNAMLAEDTLDRLPVTVQRYKQLAEETAPDFYVSIQGNDTWSGTLPEPNADGSDGPFQTLFRAQSALRDIKDRSRSLTVQVNAGIYELDKPLSLEQADSGTNEAPVIWRAADGATVILTTGKRFSPGKPVTDSNILQNLNPEQRDKIHTVDLNREEWSDYGIPDIHGTELFVGDFPMILARYPNDNYLAISELESEGTTEISPHGIPGIVEGIFRADDPKVLQWSSLADVWMHGYWFWDWSSERQKIESIDTATGMIHLTKPWHGYGYRLNQWFYAYNILSELDRPGEFYIDRENGILYYLPPEGASDTDTLTLTKGDSVIRSKDVSNLILSGFCIEGCREDAIFLDGGEGNLVANCTVRNGGGSGIVVRGTGHTVCGCHVYQMGRQGIRTEGGDRTTLTPGCCAIIDNDIHHIARNVRAYSAGASTSGVGNVIAHNRIAHLPHMALGFNGNDHLVEYNEVFDVCYESNDAGAFYTGRNWTMRGNVIRFNWFHDIQGFRNRGCIGVYFDDMFSSGDIVGNLFVRVAAAIQIGGGHDNRIVNNIFVDCPRSLLIDARAFFWAEPAVEEWINEAREKGTISGIKWNEPPYATRYPKLSKILENNPKAPEGTEVIGNLFVGSTWKNPNEIWPGDGIEDSARPYILFRDNAFPDKSIFTDAGQDDYHVRDMSGLPKVFHAIPIDKIGLYESRP